MQWNGYVTSLLMVCCFSSPAVADTPTQAPVHTAAESQQPQKSLQDPQEEKELAQLTSKEFRLLVLGTQIYLGRFGYGVGPFTGTLDPHTQDALRAYQDDAGIAETGTINKETLQHLTEDNRTLDQILPFLPEFHIDLTNWQKTMSAHGTWALENLPVAEALQTSQVSCHQKWNICSVSTAKLAHGYTPTLLSYTNIYEVETWDESTIVTKSAKTGSCVSTLLRIRREEPSITRVTTFEQAQTGPCTNVTARTVQMHMVDGAQIYRALKQQKTQDAQRILRVNHILNDAPSDSSNSSNSNRSANP